MDSSRRLLSAAVGLVGLALFCLPAVVAFRQGWLELGLDASSSMERWTIFAVCYLGWAVALMIAVVWCNDRLGVHWYAHDRASRKRPRDRRRLTAGLRFLDSRKTTGGVRRRRAKGPR